MKKVFDQTVRDIKREVNKKVLKVPGIEQKILDATSNEPWGPHGTLLAEIAQATRNYHEYQMIMAVIWKRINDTGKNWRHVYKALTVLEYLVANGSERVIDEIREHAYQTSTLSDFQYIDSSGRDQGSNVRKKSQSLVVLVNDKERIIEVRQKAAANRDKFRSTSAGGMYRPSSYSSAGGYGDRYDNDRYEGSRDEDRNGYGSGRDREYNYRDDDRYGRYGDSYSRDGDRNGREYEERYSRDGYKDDDYRGRSQSVDDYGSRSRSSDRDHGFDDDGQSSSRGSGARVDGQPHDGRQHEQKFSEQNVAPPSYKEALSESRSPGYSERNGETSAASAPGVSSPAAPRASSPPAAKAASPSASNNPTQATTILTATATPAGQEVEVADEFDPRSPVSAGPIHTAAPAVVTTSNNAEIDLIGSLSDSFTANPLAIMPVASATTTSEADAQPNFSESMFVATQPASSVMNQPFEDPFGDNPFKAIPSANDPVSAQQASVSAATFMPTVTQNAEMPPTVPQGTLNNFDFGDTFSGMTYSAVTVQPASTNSQFMPQELPTSHQETDILADILPPSGPSPAGPTQPGFSALVVQPGEPSGTSSTSIYGSYNSQAGSVALVAPNVGPHPAQFNSGNFLPPGGSTAPFPSNMAPQTPAGPGTQFNNGNLLSQQGSVGPGVSSGSHHPSNGPTPQYNNGNFLPAAQVAGHTSSGPTPQFNNANFLPHQGSTSLAVSQAANHAAGPTPQFNDGNFLQHQGYAAPVGSQVAQQTTGPTPQFNNGNLMQQQGSAAPVVSQVGYQAPSGSAAQHNSDLFSIGSNAVMASQPALPSSTGLLAQSSKDKFETKSTVWADTLNRGLVNLNISGSKINPLADIGIDFDAINRKEKRMEKPTTAAVTSTVTMGKAMGSGSGMGRAGAGAGALRASVNPMMNPGMGMASGMNMGMGGVPGMGGYGVVGQPMGMGMGVGMNMNMNRPMGMGMGQGGHMQPPGSAMPGGYNPMMGAGGYTQQPYGGGYR